MDQLQLDLATVVARLEQMADLPWFDGSHWLFRRIIDCDLPRLRSHLNADATELANRIKENAEPA